MNKNLVNKTRKLRTAAIKAAAGVTTAVSASAAWAIDTTAIQTAITAAESDALTTGEYVIGTVASLVVIGIIVAIIKKL